MIAQLDPWLLRTLCTTVAAIIVLGCILWNIRQRRLREVYAIVWLVFGAVLLLLGMFPQVIMYIAAWSGIYYLTLIMGFFFICLFVFILQVSVIVSSHSDSICTLTQQLAIAREEIKSLKRQFETSPPHSGNPDEKEPTEDKQNGSDT